MRELPRIRWVAGAALALGALPWLGLQFARRRRSSIALAMLRWLRRRARGFALLVEVEVLLFSVVMFVTINDQLFGGFTPAAADAAGRPARRARRRGLPRPRAAARRPVARPRRTALLRWAPVVALAFYALWLLWRSRRDHIARAAARARATSRSPRRCARSSARAQVLVAAFVAPTMFGFFFPGRYLVAALPLAVALVAWGMRQAPRAGAALVARDARDERLVVRRAALRRRRDRRAGPSRAPLGPLDGALPLFGTDSAGRGDRAGAVAAALVALVAYEWRTARTRLRLGS